MNKPNVGDTKGLVRRFDELGRLVIPKEFRNELDLGTKPPVEIYLLEDGVYLKKV